MDESARSSSQSPISYAWREFWTDGYGIKPPVPRLLWLHPQKEEGLSSLSSPHLARHRSIGIGDSAGQKRSGKRPAAQEASGRSDPSTENPPRKRSGSLFMNRAIFRLKFRTINVYYSYDKLHVLRGCLHVNHGNRVERKHRKISCAGG